MTMETALIIYYAALIAAIFVIAALTQSNDVD